MVRLLHLAPPRAVATMYSRLHLAVALASAARFGKLDVVCCRLRRDRRVVEAAVLFAVGCVFLRGFLPLLSLLTAWLFSSRFRAGLLVALIDSFPFK